MNGKITARTGSNFVKLEEFSIRLVAAIARDHSRLVDAVQMVLKQAEPLAQAAWVVRESKSEIKRYLTTAAWTSLLNLCAMTARQD